MENRLRLYRRIRGACRVMQWLLLVAIVAWVVFYVVVAWNVAGQTSLRLYHAHATLSRALWDYTADVRRDLVLFPPPEDTADSLAVVAWLDNLRYSAGDHAAIFLRTGKHLVWHQKPPALAEAAATLEALLADSVPEPMVLRTPEFAVERLYVPPENDDYYNTTVAEIAGPVKHARRWGILYRPGDLWYPFAARLRAAPKTPVDGPPDPLAERLETALKITPGEVLHPSIRVVKDGEPLFASPGLDTTLLAYPDSIFGASVETYLRPQDQSRLTSWVTLFLGTLFLALLFFIFQRIYRWAGKLQKGESAPARVDVTA